MIKLINKNKFDLRLGAYRRYQQLNIKSKESLDLTHPIDLTEEASQYYKSLEPIHNIKVETSGQLKKYSEVIKSYWDNGLEHKDVESEETSQEEVPQVPQEPTPEQSEPSSTPEDASEDAQTEEPANEESTDEELEVISPEDTDSDKEDSTPEQDTEPSEDEESESPESDETDESKEDESKEEDSDSNDDEDLEAVLNKKKVNELKSLADKAGVELKGQAKKASIIKSLLEKSDDTRKAM